MPLVFEAARNAGVAPRRVWQWTQVHYALFVEAVEIALASHKPAHLSVPADLDDAARVFRRQVLLPEALEIADPFGPPVWNPRPGWSLVARRTPYRRGSRHEFGGVVPFFV
jgi:hypothetical protein